MLRVNFQTCSSSWSTAAAGGTERSTARASRAEPDTACIRSLWFSEDPKIMTQNSKPETKLALTEPSVARSWMCRREGPAALWSHYVTNGWARLRRSEICLGLHFYHLLDIQGYSFILFLAGYVKLPNVYFWKMVTDYYRVREYSTMVPWESWPRRCNLVAVMLGPARYQGTSQL